MHLVALGGALCDESLRLALKVWAILRRRDTRLDGHVMIRRWRGGRFRWFAHNHRATGSLV